MIDNSYNITKNCTELNKCQNVKNPGEILSSLIIAFSNTGNVKYLEHLLNRQEISLLPEHAPLFRHIAKVISNKNIQLSEELGIKILTTFNTDQAPHGSLYIILDHMPENIKNSDIIAQIAPRVWTYYTFSSQENEAIFFIKYQKFFTITTFENRIDRLLLADRTNEAEKIIDLLNKGSELRTINEQKLKITKLCRNVSKDAIEKLYSISTNNSAVNTLLLKCMARSNFPQKALKFAQKIGSDTFLADAVWQYQNRAVIEAMNLKNYQLTKDILLASTPKIRLDYLHHQWLLGWIELQFLNNPSGAIPYFQNILSSSNFAISIARGNYWLGRAYEKLQKHDQANAFYLKAANYPATFYGQEALLKLKVPMEDAIFAHTSNIIPDVNINNPWLNAGIILKKMKFDDLGMALMQSGMNNQDISQILAIITSTSSIFDKYSTAPLTRHACRLGVFIPKISYPKVLPHANNFISSIIRQESDSAINVISDKDALGIMQIIPETAKIIAKSLRIAYSREKMLNNKEYNIRIGTEYMQKLLQKFDGSYIMAAAAYNAGPAPVRRWISQFGNPNTMHTREEIIDWIESITYSQTRNYVMRVTENFRVYETVYANRE